MAEIVEQNKQWLYELFRTPRQSISPKKLNDDIMKQMADIESLIRKIEEINLEHREMLDFAKADTATSQVSVKGTISAGTRISGSKAWIILRNTLKNVSIVETKQEGDTATSRWRMEISPPA